MMTVEGPDVRIGNNFPSKPKQQLLSQWHWSGGVHSALRHIWAAR